MDRRGRSADESLTSSWENVLLQIALPIVLILAFTTLTKVSSTIRDYQAKKAELDTVLAEYSEKREKVITFLTTLENTAVSEHVRERTEAVIELQKQKILRALGELRYEEKMRFGIYLPDSTVPPDREQWRMEAYLKVYPADEINISNGMLVDTRWKENFNKIYDVVHGRAGLTQRAFQYYRSVLDKAGLRDAAARSSQSLMHVVSQTPDAVEQSADALRDPALVLSDNRKFAWDAVQEFLREIENDTVTLQKDILAKILDYYILNPGDLEQLDQEGVRVEELKRLTRDFSSVDTRLRREQRNRILAMIEHIFKHYLDDIGYRFLAKTWEYYEF